MIVREFYLTREDGINLYKTYSNTNFMIQKVGTEEVYDVAIDVETAPFIYVETNKKVERLEEV